MARYNLNNEKLSPLVKEVATSIGFEKKCVNPFRSIIVRSLEVLYALDEAIRIIDSYEAEREKPFIDIAKRKATGYAVTEAPRGLLYHRYMLDEKGIIQDAKIVPPTSQNQKTIEEDLFDFVSQNMKLKDTELQTKCEQTVRNYDPCISCATHFLKLERING